jgi:hypothetical protein
MKIPGLDEATAEQLFNQGWKNVAALAAADNEALAAVQEISQEQLAVWVEEAGKLIDQESPAVPRPREKSGRPFGKMHA